VRNNFAKYKKQNPRLPILVRECKNVEPRLVARYGKRIA
jgi:hypothetical protein